jgi:type I restriction enzyme R subunit
VIFVNGLPLGVIELKNPADEKATIGSALNQLGTYQSQIPALFDYNCALVVSDGTEARIGVLGGVRCRLRRFRVCHGTLVGVRADSAEPRVKVRQAA